MHNICRKSLLLNFGNGFSGIVENQLIFATFHRNNSSPNWQKVRSAKKRNLFCRKCVTTMFPIMRNIQWSQIYTWLTKLDGIWKESSDHAMLPIEMCHMHGGSMTTWQVYELCARSCLSFLEEFDCTNCLLWVSNLFALVMNTQKHMSKVMFHGAVVYWPCGSN